MAHPLEKNGGKNNGSNSVFSEKHTIAQHKKKVSFCSGKNNFDKMIIMHL